MKIDSHLHFWDYHPVKDEWITDDMEVIQRDFMPADLLPQFQAAGIDAGVAVQADQSENENKLLLELAEEHSFLKGIVGWVDFRSNNITERLDYYKQFPLIKGFRHIVQSEPDDDFLLRPDFCQGIAYLRKHDYTYDILIHPRHLKYALPFCQRFSDQKLVIDHIAKPFIKEQKVDEWERDLREFKTLDHVYCKISGLITEADWQSWKVDDFKRYIDITIDVFGVDRIMFGSDWPVCLVGADYIEVCSILAENTMGLNDIEKDKLWGANCAQFYDLNL